MAAEEAKNDIALRRRMIQVLTEILADKYECTIKFKVRNEGSEDGDGNDESDAREEHRTLCINGN